MTSTTLSDQFSHLSFGDSNTPHDLVAGPLLWRISIDRDTLTDDDHKKLDKGTLKVFKFLRELNKEPDWPGLLANITAEDERLVTLISTKAEACLDRNPGVFEILRKAWDEGTFKEVRKLGTFSYLAHVFLLT
jgi:hypothetical protein